MSNEVMCAVKKLKSLQLQTMQKYWRARTVLAGQVFVVLLLLLPIVGISIWQDWKMGIEKQADEITLIANTLAARQATLVSSTQSLLISMSIAPAVQSASSEGIYNYFKELGLMQPDYTGFAFFDPQGKTLAGVFHGAPRLLPPEAIRERSYFKEAFERMEFHVSTPISTDQGVILPMTLPVVSRKGVVKGVLLAAVSVPKQQDIMQAVIDKSLFSVAFFDVSRAVMFKKMYAEQHAEVIQTMLAADSQKFFREKSYAYTENEKLAPKTFTVTVGGKDFFGAAVSLHLQNGLPYAYIVVLSDKIHFFTFMFDRYAWQIFISCILIAVLLCFARRLGHVFFSDGLERLAAVAEHNRAGDLTERCGKVLGCREIQVLSSSFDFMLDELQCKTDSLFALSHKDALTGIWNRRYFMDIADKQCHVSVRYARPLALCMGDIDFFKKVNDKYGHASGDAVLKHFAHMLNDYLRAGDVLARYGGEEFVLLLPDTDATGACALVERLRAGVEASVCTTEGHTIAITASFGVAVYAVPFEHELSVELLLKQADSALYASKHKGRNRVTLFAEDIENKPDVL